MKKEEELVSDVFADLFPKLIIKSVAGFCAGMILTYLSFVFFVCQLSISVVFASFISSIIGLVLTLGLAFSYRVRCLILLSIPQFFSRVGRYTLTCYALVLILTGPATNTLKNSEVLTESMACSQEEINTNIGQIADSLKKPLNILKKSITLMKSSLEQVSDKVKHITAKVERIVLRIGDIIQSSFTWLTSIVNTCNSKFGTPHDKCIDVVKDAFKMNGKLNSGALNVTSITSRTCKCLEEEQDFFSVADYASGSFAATIRRKVKTFTALFNGEFMFDIKIHHTYGISAHVDQCDSPTAAGIVTEIRNRANPLLTWLSWTSCVTSLFLLLIIFRAKNYEHMYSTRSRFDNRYITPEFQEIDLKRYHENRETLLPLHRREETKYMMTTSLRLMTSERLYLSRSVVFMTITTFKLLIHVVADYSLFWVLMTIHYHGSQEPSVLLPHDAGVRVSGGGPVAELLRSLFYSFTTPLRMQTLPATCLPNPYPPDYQRYAQIAILITLLWFCALFEPYGLRLRHVIMDHFKPERAKARAMWLHNHILRTRGSFMKLARRKLHREHKYTMGKKQTFRYCLNSILPCWFCRYILGTLPKRNCLLCYTYEEENNCDTKLVSCDSPHCPGVYCVSCFSDLGEMCTICLSPDDYGDLSDVSIERGSSDSNQDSSEGE